MLHSIAFIVGFLALTGCNASGQKQSTEYPLPNAASLPHRIAKSPDGTMWFTEQTGQRIGRIGGRPGRSSSSRCDPAAIQSA